MSSKKSIVKAAIGRVAMKDIGKSPMIGLVTSKPSKPEKYYPYLNLSSKDAPFLEDCKVGDAETFVVEVKIKNISERLVDGKPHREYSLDIIKIGLPNKN